MQIFSLFTTKPPPPPQKKKNIREEALLICKVFISLQYPKLGITTWLFNIKAFSKNFHQEAKTSKIYIVLI